MASKPLEAYLPSISICLPFCMLSQDAVRKVKNELKLSFLELEWEDTTSFCITDESLSKCCHFIHQARATGSSVLVHCAQVCVGVFRSAHIMICIPTSPSFPVLLFFFLIF